MKFSSLSLYAFVTIAHLATTASAIDYHNLFPGIVKSEYVNKCIRWSGQGHVPVLEDCTESDEEKVIYVPNEKRVKQKVGDTYYPHNYDGRPSGYLSGCLGAAIDTNGHYVIGMSPCLESKPDWQQWDVIDDPNDPLAFKLRNGANCLAASAGGLTLNPCNWSSDQVFKVISPIKPPPKFAHQTNYTPSIWIGQNAFSPGAIKSPSGKCMKWTSPPHAPSLKDCDGSEAESMYFDPDKHSIISTVDHSCLGAVKDPKSNSYVYGMAPCTDAPDEFWWDIVDDPSGKFTLRNQGNCFTENAAATGGLELIPCDSSNGNQLFGTATLKSAGSTGVDDSQLMPGYLQTEGKCVTFHTGNDAWKAPYLSDCTGSPEQQVVYTSSDKHVRNSQGACLVGLNQPPIKPGVVMLDCSNQVAANHENFEWELAPTSYASNSFYLKKPNMGPNGNGSCLQGPRRGGNEMTINDCDDRTDQIFTIFTPPKVPTNGAPGPSPASPGASNPSSPVASGASVPLPAPGSAPGTAPVTTQVPASSPVAAPVSAPISTPVGTQQVTGPNPGGLQAHSSGDPHFSTWNRTKYDFHGGCDLVLLENADFKEIGIRIHVRTVIETWWSFIQSAAIQIGDDIIEVRGGGDGNLNYWINGHEGTTEDVSQDENVRALMEHVQAKLPHFKIGFKKVKSDHNKIVIRLNESPDVVILENFKEWVSVNVHIRGISEAFAGTKGLMGLYPSGAMVARDGQTVISDSDVFGKEWQVLENEPMLFHNIEGVQAPTECAMPTTTASERRRRLGQSVISQEDAERACGHAGDGFDACVYDVLATNDKDFAGAY